MKPVFAIVISLSLAWSCHDPPPKSDPQMASVTSNAAEGENQHIGHIVLQVSDLERSVDFYQNVLDLDVNERAAFEERQRVFLSGSSAHHEIVLMQAQNKLPHDMMIQQVAFEVSDQQELAAYYQRLKKRGIDAELKDNGISWSLYFNDPDQLQIEVFWEVRDENFGRDAWRGNQQELSVEDLVDPPRRG